MKVRVVQTELALGDAQVQVPWGGQSPRELTRVGIGLFSKRERGEDDRFFVDPRQVDLFRAAMKGSPEYRGAPSLLPLPEELR